MCNVLVQSEATNGGFEFWERFTTMRKGWSYAYDRRIIELAEAGMSVEEAARILNRTPAGVRRSSIRLGVSFKPAAKPKQKPKPKST
jgi:hypothetical protein